MTASAVSVSMRSAISVIDPRRLPALPLSGDKS